MSKCEYCGSYIEYATAKCLECGECMLCWPEECSCVVIEPYNDLGDTEYRYIEKEDEEEEDEGIPGNGLYRSH